MTSKKAAETHSFPKTVAVGDRSLTLRLLTASDRAELDRFIAELSPHDLFFLRRDITDPAVIDDWLDNVAKERVSTIAAFEKQIQGEPLLGYATVHPSDLSWSSHVAELRVLVGPQSRGLGLGKVLTQEAFRYALATGIEKMVARMTLDQKSAVAVFESLGFQPEALLKNHVKDRRGKKHDLLVMSHDVAAFQNTLASYGVPEAVEAIS